MWPEFILFRSDRAFSAPASTRIFHAGGWRVGLLFGPAVQRLGFGIGRVLQFRRRRRRELVRVLQAAGGKGLDQLNFRRGISVDGVHAGQMPRAAKRQDRAGQRDDESGPEIMAFQRAQRGIHRRLWNSFEHAKDGGNWRAFRFLGQPLLILTLILIYSHYKRRERD